MSEQPLEMTVQERMMVLSFASKSVEMLERGLPPKTVMDLQQWNALAGEVKPILKRLDQDWPTMLPLPHDGIPWGDRK